MVFKFIIVLFLAVFFACRDRLDSDTSAVISGHVAEYYLWKVNEIPVCWEGGRSKDQSDKVWIERVVKEEYAPLNIQFTGWQACPSQEFDGIKIYLHHKGRTYDFSGSTFPGHPRASIGRHPNSFVILSLDFEEVKPFLTESCAGKGEERRLQCVRSIVLHELMHVLGFSHEHSRIDSLCTDESHSRALENEVNIVFGSYDPQSIMNYCWTHSGGGLGSGLSDEDKKAVKALFEKPGQIPKSLATYIDPEKTSNWLSKRQEKTTWEYECQKYENGFEFVFQKKMKISEIVDKSSPVCKGWSYFTNLCSRVRNKISSKDAIVCGPGYLKTKAYTP